MVRAIVGVGVLVVVSLAHGFQADLVPLRIGPVTEDLEGSVSIGGEDGRIRAIVESLNDERGEPLDGTATLQLRLRVDGRRRRVSLPIVLDTGDGQAETSLNVVAGARIVVKDARLRGPDGRTLAIIGVLTEAPAVTTTTLPQPPSNDCPAGLAACQTALSASQTELLECVDELTICEEVQ